MRRRTILLSLVVLLLPAMLMSAEADTTYGSATNLTSFGPPEVVPSSHLVSGNSSHELKLAGHVGGYPSTGLDAMGTIFYVGESSYLSVVDYSDPASPRMVGKTTPFPDQVNDVSLSGDYAYVAARGSGLWVVNIVDPTSPQIVGHLPIFGRIYELEAIGDRVYVRVYVSEPESDYRVHIIDVTSPIEPVERFVVDTEGYAEDFSVDGDYLYVADRSLGLVVYDVSLPSSPQQVASLDGVGKHSVIVREGLGFIGDRQLSGSRLYSRLRGVDLTDPTQPITMSGTCSAGAVSDLALVDGILSASSAEKEYEALVIFDVSDPESPQRLGDYESGSFRATGQMVVGHSVLLNGVLGNTERDGEVHIIDINQPALPTELGRYEIPCSVRGVTVQGEYAFIADGWTGGLRVVNVSNRSSPTLAGSYFSAGNAWKIISHSPGYVYLIEAGSSTNLYGFDVRNVGNPRVVGFYNVPASDIRFRDMVFAGDYGYVSHEAYIWIFDVSRPGGLSRITTYQTDCSYVQSLAIKDDRLLFSGCGLGVLGISEPTEPVQIDVPDYIRAERDVVVSGDYAYVANGDLSIVDVSNPDSPVEMAYYPTPGDVQQIAVADGYVYIGEYGSDGLIRVIDVSMPSSPVEVATYLTPGRVQDLTVSAGYVYVADNLGGLVILQHQGAPDSASPGSITDLTAESGPNSGEVILSWTAPGDDGYDGTASAYTVRYADAAIETELGWLNATDVSGEPTPQPVGTPQSMTVSGLTPGQTYYFAIGAEDEAGNVSPLSNSPHAIAAGEALYTISGQVRDNTEAPLADVIVSTADGASATTDADGNYTITGLEASVHTFTPYKDGYTFSPISRTITVPLNATGQDFTAWPCVGPSGLDICRLRPGDIMVSRSPTYAAVFSIGGTYFTHAMMYLGFAAAPNGVPSTVEPRLAEAQGSHPDSSYDVWETDLTRHRIWTGEGVDDWAVVRPQLEESVKENAVTYARDKAAEDGVIFDLSATKEDNKRFYCSKLVWRSYRDVIGGIDLQTTRGVGSTAFGLYWVTPDDLYFSSPEVASGEVGDTGNGRWRTTLWSPAHLTLVDDEGRRTGYNAVTGDILLEIPGVDYYAPPDAEVETITAVSVQAGWQIIVTGYENGEYVLESMYIDRDALVSVERGTTEPGQVDVYDVEGPAYGVFLPMVTQ